MLGGLFSLVPDRRTAKGRRFELEPLLCSLLLAILSGSTSLRKMELFINERLDQLNALFGTHWKAAPSWVGIRRFLLTLDVEQLEQAVRQQAQQLSQARVPDGYQCIAIDGKALRGSACRLTDSRARQLVSALRQDQCIVLGHVEVSDKSNEMPAARALIAALGQPGALFTLDALHCQKNPGNGAGERGRCAGASEGQPGQAA